MSGAGSLSTRRVLIVEDEPVVALMTQTIVERLGHAVLGPAATVTTAMDLLESYTPDFALLDVRLPGATSFPIADLLTARGVPFAFLTAQGDLPDRFAGTPTLRKPYRPEALRALVQALSQPGHSS
jgi:DNA-binding response OmpR family regulator